MDQLQKIQYLIMVEQYWELTGIKTCSPGYSGMKIQYNAAPVKSKNNYSESL